MVRIAALLIGLFCSTTSGETYLVKGGAPLAEIVIAEAPPPIIRAAAGDLQEYVEKITGANLPIVTAPSEGVPVQIYVGQSRHTERLSISGDDLLHDAYRVVSGDNWLVLIGRDREWEPKGLMKLAADKKAWVAPGRRRNYDHRLWKEWD